MTYDLLWFLCVNTTLFSLLSLWFISPLNKRASNDMKHLWIAGTLGSPVVFTLLCIGSWVLFLFSGEDLLLLMSIFTLFRGVDE